MSLKNLLNLYMSTLTTAKLRLILTFFDKFFVQSKSDVVENEVVKLHLLLMPKRYVNSVGGSF